MPDLIESTNSLPRLGCEFGYHGPPSHSIVNFQTNQSRVIMHTQLFTSKDYAKRIERFLLLRDHHDTHLFRFEYGLVSRRSSQGRAAEQSRNSLKDVAHAFTLAVYATNFEMRSNEVNHTHMNQDSWTLTRWGGECILIGRFISLQRVCQNQINGLRLVPRLVNVNAYIQYIPTLSVCSASSTTFF